MFYLTNKEARKPCDKHDDEHFRKRGKFRKHQPQNIEALRFY